jgi:energy-coupling factor transporter transmembrane protein EcfT
MIAQGIVSDGLLGSGAGPLSAARPSVRLACGALAVGAIVLSPGALGPGALFTATVALAVVLAAGPSQGVVLRALQFGALLYLPLVLVLLIPLLWEAAGSAGVLRASRISTMLVLALTIALKGGATLLAALSTLTTIRRAELHMAVAGLPLPRTVRLLLLQIAHQTGTLFGETVQIRRAIAVRAPARRGTGASLQLLLALPGAWLERVAGRAERVAMALELRGYHLHGGKPLPAQPARRCADAVAVAGGLAALAGALALHFVV